MEFIDLRSDTVTKPTPEMRAAMAAAAVGDDVYGEDPTVNELEAVAAHMTGKAAALFVASGTMGNVAAMMAHTQRGAEVICGYQSHVFRNEQGQLAQLCGVQAHPLREAANGTLPLDLVAGAIQGDDQHHPITSVLALENTQNMCGGLPVGVDYMRAAGSLARAHGLKLHVDGARLFNAAVALNVSAAELVADADSVTFCLSKGLAAPAGSVLCGDVEFIKRARRARKVLG
ncbi:MAG: aminotransferase class I/II-fold pyridoxal phosphate-dependent enzyme, partial [Chloroflexi bacterium]|nr:aminotransferase class I/II-fold pyridoxal phosphate-dependent enzyme [Chloroflexota bacterium]